MCIFALDFFVKTEYRPIYQVNTCDAVSLSVASRNHVRNLRFRKKWYWMIKFSQVKWYCTFCEKLSDNGKKLCIEWMSFARILGNSGIEHSCVSVSWVETYKLKLLCVKTPEKVGLTGHRVMISFQTRSCKLVLIKINWTVWLEAQIIKITGHCKMIQWVRVKCMC